MNPPFRSPKHIEACIAALCDGTIDIISSGHSPRASEKTLQELDLAPFGISSLETTLGIVGQYLVRPGHLTWSKVIEKMSLNPAKLLGIPKGTLQVGVEADVTVIDPQQAWTVTPSTFRSKSSNTPFGGKPMWGKVVQVFVAGESKRI